MTQYVSKAKHLLRLLGADRSINELRLSQIEEYVDARLVEIKRIRPSSTRAIATVGKELGLLRSALRYMAKQRGPDGFKLYRYETDEIFPEGIIGNYKPRDRALSISEYHALYIALPADRREYLQAFCGLGARDSELYRITPIDVERHARRVRIPGTKTEAAERWLQPPPELFEILARRSEVTPLGQPVFPRWLNVRRALEVACKRAGIARVSPNDLRRTFASWQAEAGVPEAVTASLMGHTSSQMVRRVYGRIGSDAKRDALAKLPPLAPPPAVMLSVINEGAKQSAERQERQPPRRALTQKAAQNAAFLVPRDSIELPTRGFSILMRQKQSRAPGRPVSEDGAAPHNAPLSIQHRPVEKLSPEWPTDAAVVADDRRAHEVGCTDPTPRRRREHLERLHRELRKIGAAQGRCAIMPLAQQVGPVREPVSFEQTAHRIYDPVFAHAGVRVQARFRWRSRSMELGDRISAHTSGGPSTARSVMIDLRALGSSCPPGGAKAARQRSWRELGAEKPPVADALLTKAIRDAQTRPVA